MERDSDIDDKDCGRSPFWRNKLHPPHCSVALSITCRRYSRNSAFLRNDMRLLFTGSNMYVLHIVSVHCSQNAFYMPGSVLVSVATDVQIFPWQLAIKYIVVAVSTCRHSECVHVAQVCGGRR